jgi:hypothetical protein
MPKYKLTGYYTWNIDCIDHDSSFEVTHEGTKEEFLELARKAIAKIKVASGSDYLDLYYGNAVEVVDEFAIFTEEEFMAEPNYQDYYDAAEREIWDEEEKREAEKQRLLAEKKALTEARLKKEEAILKKENIASEKYTYLKLKQKYDNIPLDLTDPLLKEIRLDDRVDILIDHTYKGSKIKALYINDEEAFRINNIRTGNFRYVHNDNKLVIYRGIPIFKESGVPLNEIRVELKDPE